MKFFKFSQDNKKKDSYSWRGAIGGAFIPHYVDLLSQIGPSQLVAKKVVKLLKPESKSFNITPEMKEILDVTQKMHPKINTTVQTLPPDLMGGQAGLTHVFTGKDKSSLISLSTKDPAVLAHELGHAVGNKNAIMRNILLRRSGIIEPTVLLASSAMMGSDKYRDYAPATLGVGYGVTRLLPEIQANVSGYKILRQHLKNKGLPYSELSKHFPKMLLALGSYSIPVAGATLGAYGVKKVLDHYRPVNKRNK